MEMRLMDLKECCNNAQEKLCNVGVEIQNIEDGLDILMHGIDSQALKNFMNTIKYACKQIRDIYIEELDNSLLNIEAGIDSSDEFQFGTLPGLDNVEVIDDDSSVIAIDTPVKKRGRKKKNDDTVDELIDKSDKATEK